MNRYKTILTIAGSDSGGGAGIQADIKTCAALGCYASSAITAITAQNTQGVWYVQPLSADLVVQQIECVLQDIGADVVKIGMLGSVKIVEAVADVLLRFGVEKIVLDPVLVSTSGDPLSSDEAVTTILERLVPLATVVTPNLDEAAQMSGIEAFPENYDAIWQFFKNHGAKALLLKGGHALRNDQIIDFLYTTTEKHAFEAEYIETPNTHGTGCTLSSAIAAYMAHGETLEHATEHATAYIHHAIAAGREYQLGQGHGPVMHFFKYWQ